MRSASWKQGDERSNAIETLYRERYGRFCDGVATITGDYESARGTWSKKLSPAPAQSPHLSGRGLARGPGLAHRPPDGA